VTATGVPDSRIVYVDNDPLVLTHAQALLTSGLAGRTAFIHADLRQPETILANAVLRETLDFSQPIALMLNALLHFIPDDDEPGAIVSTLMAALPAGSYLVSTHVTPELDPDSVHGLERIYRAGGLWAGARTGDEFRRMFFDDLDLVPPGLVPVTEWHPTGNEPRPPADEVNANAAVGRKPPASPSYESEASVAEQDAADGWDLIVAPWHLDERIPAFPVPAGAAETICPTLPDGFR
jgi:S-adenosyl methyltransferase